MCLLIDLSVSKDLLQFLTLQLRFSYEAWCYRVGGSNLGQSQVDQSGLNRIRKQKRDGGTDHGVVTPATKKWCWLLKWLNLIFSRFFKVLLLPSLAEPFFRIIPIKEIEYVKSQRI